MKTFLLTGCASGIGRRLTEELLRRGDRVVATDVNEEELRKTGWPETRRLDVRDAAAWESLLDEIGPVDVVMNIAGVMESGWVHEMTPRAVAIQLDVNVRGVMFGTAAAAKRMVRQGRGHIVNISSLSALTPVPGLAVYSATKYAVRGYSLAAAYELRRHGVYVTTVCPDGVATPMLAAQKERHEAALAFSGARLLRPEDVVRAILRRALPRRPLEVWIPRYRGWMVRIGDLWPGATFLLEPLFRRLGRAKQTRAM